MDIDVGEPFPRIDQTILKKILEALARAPDDVYSPAEDSFLMLEALSTIPVTNKKVLDLGTGSGILGLYCAMRGAIATVTDIDPAAVIYARKAAQTLGLTLTAVHSDLFSNVSERFDLVIFNPPYLSSETFEDRTVDGGKSGRVLVERFLAGLPTHLNENGIALLLLSSQNDPASLMADQQVFEASVVAKRALFFEELQVLSLRFRGNAARQ
jgi:release factor glutamine methyltransferase